MIEGKAIAAAATIRLLQSIEALYLLRAVICGFLVNARKHDLKKVADFLDKIMRQNKK